MTQARDEDAEELGKHKSGARLGYCFVELLPGVYNKNNPFAVFVRS